MNLRRTLEARLQDALVRAGAPGGAPALVGPSTSPSFGDYQANGVMAAARQIKTAPRKLAEKVAAAVELKDIAEKVEIAGPGFINITLKDDFLAAQLAVAAADERLGVAALSDGERKTVVVDYSGPNLAKEMHVGHLRSTIIGDALARTLEFLGHRVIRQNHVGDWGKDFGLIVAYLSKLREKESDTSQPSTFDIAQSDLQDLEGFYSIAKGQMTQDAQFSQAASDVIADLHRGGQQYVPEWEAYREKSLQHCEEVYKRLGVGLSRNDVRGESAYNDDLSEIVKALGKAGLLAESQGARCVFLEEFKDSEGKILPVIVQKSDGAYLYATTDLAALRYRVRQLKADRILYVTDSRQALHFRQVFAVGRKAGFAPQAVSLEHIGFGTMMGADGRPFKTREGGTIKLMDLLDQAEKQAFDLVTQKNPDLPDDRRREIARMVGIGAVKYADLAQNRASDYVFSWNKMLSLDGNTAPYMQYAYARIRSIFRKSSRSAGVPPAGGATGETPVVLAAPAERNLAVRLLQFPETIETVAAECLPNLLCGYLYELAGAFMSFYESCPVLQSDEPLKSSRLAMCELTARTIRTGLELLGIEALEQM